MPRNSILSRLRSFLCLEKKPVNYARFSDPLGDFEISYPDSWRYDRSIAVVEGKYSISFESVEGCFTIAVDTAIPGKFNFRSYAKKELEGPSAGIIATMKKYSFRGMPAYRREYTYSSGRTDFFGSEIMFYTGREVFLISWNGREKKKKELQTIFEHMLESLAIGEGFLVRMRRK